MVQTKLKWQYFSIFKKTIFSTFLKLNLRAAFSILGNTTQKLNGNKIKTFLFYILYPCFLILYLHGRFAAGTVQFFTSILYIKSSFRFDFTKTR